MVSEGFRPYHAVKEVRRVEGGRDIIKERAGGSSSSCTDTHSETGSGVYTGTHNHRPQTEDSVVTRPSKKRHRGERRKEGWGRQQGGAPWR